MIQLVRRMRLPPANVALALIRRDSDDEPVLFRVDRATSGISRFVIHSRLYEKWSETAPSSSTETHVKGERLGEFEELVLLCVKQLGDEAHTSAIQTTLAEEGGREVTLGAIYSALDRTQRKGFVDSWLGEPTSERGGRAKRHYAVTAQGEAALSESREIRERLWAAAEAAGS